MNLALQVTHLVGEDSFSCLARLSLFGLQFWTRTVPSLCPSLKKGAPESWTGWLFEKCYVAGLYGGHVPPCAAWWLLVNLCGSAEGDIDLKSNIRLLEGVAQEQGSAQETGRVTTTWNQNLSYEFCILTLCVLGSGLGISHQVGASKKKKPQPKSRNAVVISDWLFSSSKYVLRNAWSCAGLQREGSSLHHGQGCQEGQRGGFSPNFALAPKTASSFFLFFLWLGLRDCLHGIWIDSGKNFSLCDIIICLIQAKAWSGTMLVHSSSDW